MADKVEKPKKSKPKPKKGEKGVLAALPSTRPERIGTRRVNAPKASDEPEAAQAAAPSTRARKPARTRAKSAPAKTAASKRAAGSAKRSRATAAAKRSPAAAGAAKRSATKSTAARKPAAATRRKAAAPGTFEPTEAAETAAGAADERAADAVLRAAMPPPPPPAPEPRPRPVREGAPGMGTSGAREQQPASEQGRPSGVDLVSTAVKAAGELTQVGLTIGGQIIKRAVRKLPKP
jgi:histone H1/5